MANTFDLAKLVIEQNIEKARKTFYGILIKKLCKDIRRGVMHYSAVARWYVLGRRYGLIKDLTAFPRFAPDLRALIERYEFFGLM